MLENSESFFYIDVDRDVTGPTPKSLQDSVALCVDAAVAQKFCAMATGAAGERRGGDAAL